MAKVDVAVMGVTGKTGFGWVAQRIARKLFEGHPYFNLAALISDNPEHQGKPFSECMKWYGPGDLPEALGKMTLSTADPDALGKVGDIKLVISALPPMLSPELDPKFAKAGIPVVSESPGLRNDPDIPLVVPEINADHLSILEDQKKKKGWKSFIVSNPVCTVTIIVMSMKPIIDTFGIKRCFQVTLQALSGAGPEGIPSLAIVENFIPYIKLEEDKLETEGPKILGTIKNGQVVSNPIPISSSCNRIPIINGHTICMFAETEKPLTVEEAKKVFAGFRGPAQELGLPSAPEKPIVVLEQEDRPQPRLDRGLGNGMIVSVGRIRKDPVFTNGIKWIVCGDNMVRGTAGNTILNAELLYKKGLL